MLLASLDEYQRRAEKTALYREECERMNVRPLVYVRLGLVGELGEIAELIKKMLRDDGGVLTDERRERLLGEIGDFLWYCAAAHTETGRRLSEAAQYGNPGRRRREVSFYSLDCSANDPASLPAGVFYLQETALDMIIIRDGYEAIDLEASGRALRRLAGLARVAGLTLQACARRNLEKLADRQKRNAIHGEGDMR